MMKLRPATLALFALVCSGCVSSEGDATTAAPDDRMGPHDVVNFGAVTSVDTAGSGGGAGSPSGDPASAGLCATAASDPVAASTVGAYLDTLGEAGPKSSLRPAIIDAVIRACDAFAPPAKSGGWQRSYCWAHLASEIFKESSFDPASVVTDSYATREIGNLAANDPTVGLLQVRFSSVVKDFVTQGARNRLSCVGCTLPASLDAHKSDAGDSAFWAVTGPALNQSLVESVACNVGLGAWYVYLGATGNGKRTAATYLEGYCSGQGAAGNLITGFRSFLEGPSSGKGVIANQAALNALQNSDGDAYAYVTAIKSSFDTMTGPLGGPHPFFLPMAPSPTQYCE